MMNDVVHILFLILYVYISVNITYLLIAAIAGHTASMKRYAQQPQKKKIAVLITSFREDAIIVNTLRQAATHNYPASSFAVHLAADHLQPQTIQQLQKLNIHVHEVRFETGSKARSLNYLLNHISEDDYDIALVLDGDNIMESGFLEKINAAFHSGCRAAQGHRTAKNTNTPIAILDAISEEINNHLFRKSQRAMGLSSATIGSGMAFEFKKLKQVYNKPGILDNPACDREVDFEMMRSGIVVEYLDDALVFDEKVSKQKVYENQRRRWMESQIIHLRLFFNEHVTNKTADYWNKLFINLIPPRIIYIAAFAAVFFIYFIQYVLAFNIVAMPLSLWIILVVAYAFVMLISTPRKFFSFQTLKAVIYLPVLVLSALKAATSMKPRRKEFVHTPKSYTGDDVE